MNGLRIITCLAALAIAPIDPPPEGNVPAGRTGWQGSMSQRSHKRGVPPLDNVSSREFTIFKATASPLTNVVSREFTVLRSASQPPLTNVVSREFSVYVRFPPPPRLNVVSREFTVEVFAPDLEMTSSSAAPRGVAAGDSLEFTWSVTNIGHRDAEGPWTDRATLSTNEVLGDGDDVSLGEFDAGPLAAGQSYEATEVLTIPIGTALGDHYIFAHVDADDAVTEQLGYDNNVGSVRISVVPELEPSGACIQFDIEDGTHVPIGPLVLSGRADPFRGLVNVLYVIDVSSSTGFVCGFDCNYDGFIDAADDQNGDNSCGANGGDVLDCEIGAMLMVDSLTGTDTAARHAAVVFSGEADILDTGPEPSQQTWLSPFDRDADSSNIPDFEEAGRSLDVERAGLFTPIYLPGGTNFDDAIVAADIALNIAAPANRDLLIFLTDGEPSPEGAVPTDEELTALAEYGIDFRAFQLGGQPVTENGALQGMADVIDAHPVSSGSAVTVLDASDLLDAIVRSLGIVAVTVNGVQADSLDTADHFFHAVTIVPGENCFVVTAIDGSGGECSDTLCIVGVQPDEPDVSEFSDVTTSIDVDYFNSTYNRTLEVFVTEARAQNVGSLPLVGSVVMVMDNVTASAVTLMNPDGFTPDGKPFVVFADETGDALWDSQEYSEPHVLIFSNPEEQQPVSFEVSWLAPDNEAPFFTSVPQALVVLGSNYAYDAAAEDPDGHTIHYSLETAPEGMDVHPDTGAVSWSPADELGTHSIKLVATDDYGGRAEQMFVLSVVATSANRPPAFCSAPITHASVGAAYEYQACATDPDDDAITYGKVLGLPCEFENPDDLVVELDGRVHMDFATPGDCTVGIRVDDGNRGYAEQRYVLTVGDEPTNPNAPRLYGTPSSIAAVDSLYFYQPVVSDPDPDDVVQCSLPIRPTEMVVDPDTCRVTWVPDALEVGIHPVELAVTDGNGGRATQEWEIEVLLEPENRPPVIDSIPGLVTTVDGYEYQVHATDPDGQSVTCELVNPPPGMDIDAETCLLIWAAPSTGTYTVTIKASDPNGAFGSQVYDLEVWPLNDPPSIDQILELFAMVGGVYHYDVHATDPNSDVLTYVLRDDIDPVPDGMTINVLTGLIRWTPDVSQLGTHSIKVRVSDRFGAADEETFSISVDMDEEPPEVQIAFSQEPAHINEPVMVCVQAADEVGIVERTLTADGDPVELDDFGCATLTFSLPGEVDFVATASDAAGNVETVGIPDPVVLQVIDRNAGKPHVTLISPAAESVITSPVNIVASITPDPNTPNPNAIVSWDVKIARLGTEDFITIREGEGEVLEDVVALFDPTLLPNDTYIVQIVGFDGAQTGGIEFRYHVAGDYKLGNFKITLTDLTIPVAGIPLVITRIYDSLDTTPGDFGPGWRLGLSGQVTDNAWESMTGDEFTDRLGSEAFARGTRVYVTRPDGRRVGFTFEPVSVFFWIARPEFQPDPGVEDTLEVATEQLWYIRGRFYEYVIPFNPREYIFTTKEGVKYTIDEFDGLQHIEDANGNTIDVTPGGLISSTGVSLIFERNDDGFITEITEPEDGGKLNYVYDEVTGHLIEFRDQTYDPTEPAPTRYHYEDLNFPNYLTGIEDPMGRDVIRSVFDDDGRLIAQCNADADMSNLPDPCADDPAPATPEGCTMFCFDSGSDLQTIINARGFRVDLFLDTRGNILRERHYMTDPAILDPDDPACDPHPCWVETQRAYDDNDNMLTESDPLESTWTFTYDERGNVLSKTDPSNERTWTYTYNECNKVLTECDPMNNCTAYTYGGYVDAGDTCNAGAGCGLLCSEEDPLDGVTTYRFNERGQVSDILYPLDTEDHHRSFSYDGYGFPDGYTDQLGHSASMHFNRAGELEWVVDRNGSRIDFTYDDAHRLETETWDTEPPRVATYEYFANGQIKRAEDPDSVLSVDYWNTGHVMFMDNAGTPDAPHVVITYGYYDGPDLTTGYDPNGNVTHVMDSLGGMTQYQYDPLDRLGTVLQYEAPSPSPSPGPGTSPGDGDGDHDVDLSDLARFQAACSGAGQRVPPGDLWADLDQDLDVDLQDFQAIAGLLRGPLGANGSASRAINHKRVDFVYDDASPLRELQRFADLAATLPVTNTYYNYECGGCPLHLTSIHHRKATDNSVIHDIDFIRDALGNILHMADAEGDHEYTYDGLRRLLTADHPDTTVCDQDSSSVGDPCVDDLECDGGACVPLQPDEFYQNDTTSYDAVGNRQISHLSSEYVYSYELGLGGNQLRQDDQFDYEYDNNGNLILRTDRVAGYYTEYSYDHRNRMIRFVEHGTETTQFLYVYDAANRRIRAEEETLISHFVYDGRNPILKLGDVGAEISRRMYTRLIDGILADQVPTGTRWFLTDQVGTVRDLHANGAIHVNHYVYDSFGRLVGQEDTGVMNDLLFNGREFSPAVGLGYYRARFYDPRIGRFIREDPLAPHCYDYVDNNPIVFNDPLGETELAEWELLMKRLIFVAIGDALCVAQGTDPLWCKIIVLYALFGWYALGL